MTVDDLRFTAVLHKGSRPSAILLRLLKLIGFYSLLALGASVVLITSRVPLSLASASLFVLAIASLAYILLSIVTSISRLNFRLNLRIGISFAASVLITTWLLSREYVEYKKYLNKQREVLEELAKWIAEASWVAEAEGSSPGFQVAAIDQGLLERIIEAENHYSPSNGSPRRAIGLMQIIPSGPNLTIETGIAADYKAVVYPSGGNLGEYTLEETPALKAFMKAFDAAVKELIAARYRHSIVEIEVIGYADGTKVGSPLVYRGDLGPIKDVPYFSHDSGRVEEITLVPGHTLTNESIAFLRALALSRHLTAAIPSRRSDVRIGVDTTNRIGPEYRKVITVITVRNALENEYRELGTLAKGFIQARPLEPGGRSDRGARRRFLDDLPFGTAISDSAERHSVDGLLIAAIVKRESGFQLDATSPKGAVGLMQILPGEAYQARDLLDPYVNIDVGSRYLSSLLAAFDGDVELAVAAYNAGAAAVIRYKGVPPYRETRRYVRDVLAFYKEYSWRAGVENSPSLERKGDS